MDEQKKFDSAIEFVLQYEDEFYDASPHDGASKRFGLSLCLLASLSKETLQQCNIFNVSKFLTVHDLKELTLEQVKLIYKCLYWDEGQFHKMEDEFLRNYIFDMAIRWGAANAVKFVKRAICAVFENPNAAPDDGVMDEETLSLLVHSTSCCVYTALRAAIIATQAEFMRQQGNDKDVLKKLLNRCYRT